MGRRNLIRLVALIALLAFVPAATAAGTPRTTFVLEGTTTPSGSQAPEAYLALHRADEASWLARVEPAQRTRVRSADLTKHVLVAGFLDGAPCASDVAVRGWTEAGSRLTVQVTYKKPPIGVATCVRTSTSYFVMSVSRALLSRVPASVRLSLSARS